jgi:uncharacterized coiled-coil protein SlyX
MSKAGVAAKKKRDLEKFIGEIPEVATVGRNENKEILELTAQVSEQSRKVEELTAQVSEKNRKVEELTAQVSELTAQVSEQGRKNAENIALMRDVILKYLKTEEVEKDANKKIIASYQTIVEITRKDTKNKYRVWNLDEIERGTTQCLDGTDNIKYVFAHLGKK